MLAARTNQGAEPGRKADSVYDHSHSRYSQAVYVEPKSLELLVNAATTARNRRMCSQVLTPRLVDIKQEGHVH